MRHGRRLGEPPGASVSRCDSASPNQTCLQAGTACASARTIRAWRPPPRAPQPQLLRNPFSPSGGDDTRYQREYGARTRVRSNQGFKMRARTAREWSGALLGTGSRRQTLPIRASLPITLTISVVKTIRSRRAEMRCGARRVCGGSVPAWKAR